MLALTLITAGLVRHYRPNMATRWLATLAISAVVLNPLVIFDLPRGGLAQALAYQLPFAVMSAIAAATVVASSRRTLDLILAVVLGLCALQFVAKAVFGSLLDDGHAPGVRDYVFSVYAYYSQTLGTILSILLGLALVGLVVTEIVAESARRVQRDPLSGALTRSAFLDQAAEILRNAAPPRSTGLIICDLDHFKSVNDRFGHAAGDDMICTFGDLLREAAGSDGVCGRIGGEEFCILLTDRSAARVRAEVEALRIRLARASYPLIPAEVQVTASFGSAMTDAHESRPTPCAGPISRSMRRRPQAATNTDWRCLPRCQSSKRDHFAVAAMTSTSISMPGQASWLIATKVPAGGGRPAKASPRHFPASAK
jgi:diguanylate cyclase (GGDEF)-like protein